MPYSDQWQNYNEIVAYVRHTEFIDDETMMEVNYWKSEKSNLFHPFLIWVWVTICCCIDSIVELIHFSQCISLFDTLANHDGLNYLNIPSIFPILTDRYDLNIRLFLSKFLLIIKFVLAFSLINDWMMNKRLARFSLNYWYWILNDRRKGYYCYTRRFIPVIVFIVQNTFYWTTKV